MSKPEETKKPVVIEAVRMSERANGNSDKDIVILADGHRARVKPVSATLIEEITSAIKAPKVPVIHDEERNRDLENPDDPDYIRAVEDANRARGIAAMDAMVLLGVELLDGVPPDEEWLPNLRLLEKLGRLNLSAYDLSDPLERAFVYKRLIAVDTNVLNQVGRRAGVTPAAVAEAEDAFRS